jgi:hypothetical protein
MKIVDFILARLKEPSTWRGITAFAGVVGISLSPEYWDAIASATIGIIALIEVIRRESK